MTRKLLLCQGTETSQAPEAGTYKHPIRAKSQACSLSAVSSSFYNGKVFARGIPTMNVTVISTILGKIETLIQSSSNRAREQWW